MYVISAKVIGGDDKDNIPDWRYAGAQDSCAQWHRSHLSATKFISADAAKRWWNAYRETLLVQWFPAGKTLDKDSITIRKIVFNRVEKLD